MDGHLPARPLSQLAAFPGNFDLALIETVSGPAASRALGGLVDRSLVTPSADRTTYRILETVKLFARGTWEQTSEPADYLDRHAQALLTQIDAWSEDDKHMDLGVAAWHIRHVDDLRAADSHLRASGRSIDAARLWTAGVIGWHISQPSIAVSVLVRMDIALADQELPIGVRARVELCASGAAMAARDPARLIASADRAVQHAEQAGPDFDVARAFALNVKSWMTMVSDLPAALRLLDESQTLADAAGAPLVGLAARGYSGVARALHGDLEVVDLVPGIESAAPTEGTYVLNATRSLFIICRLFDDPLEALRQNEVVFDALVAAGIDLPWSSHNLRALAFAAAGLVEETVGALEVAEHELRRSGNDDGLPDLLLGPAVLAYSMGEPEMAARWATAVQVSPKPTQSLPMTSFYRQLRVRVGLAKHSEDLMDTPAIYAEARDWINRLRD
ncbi:MAG: hypothetical protein ACI8TP_004987 [Acidimicrobiales bacterium]